MTVSRRQFLATAGSGVAAVALVGRPGWLTARRPSRASDSDWDALAQRLRGRLIRPGAPGYGEAALPDNLRYAAALPAGVAWCADAHDVATAITWAREHAVPFAARSGGHSYAGYSTTRGLLINVNGMTTVTYDEVSGTLRAVGGARNADTGAVLQAANTTVSAGRCPSVGVAGLTLGGGFGFSARKLGLACDALLATEVVQADGTIVTADADQNADLFWACRGGGGGTFGINTAFTFQTTPVGNVTVYRLNWSSANPVPILDAFQQVLAIASDDFSTRVGVGTFTNGASKVSAVGQYFGPAAELRELLAPVFAVEAPTTSELSEVTYWQGRDLLADDSAPGYFVERSRFAPAPIGADGLGVIEAALHTKPPTVAASSATFKLFSWGGAINRVAADATAFVHRDDFALASIGATWQSDERAGKVEALQGWVDELWSDLGNSTSNASYQNFADPALRPSSRAYFGANLARLERVKRSVDPDNVFRFAQSVQPA
jgi:FAD/FMN-containing dehydrogenase